jgi:putative ABC transport system permease protein
VRSRSLLALLRGDVRRARGTLVASGFGIAAGIAALVFFLALGLGVRKVLLGDVFPIEQVELEPPRAADPGLVGLLFGGGPTPGIEPDQVEALRAVPGVTGVYPKLRFAFPSSARGGKELFGREVGTSELVGDGIEPSLLGDEAKELSIPFVDPMAAATVVCKVDTDCAADDYCERPTGSAEGKCSAPVPVLVSRYLVEIFDKSLAPAHGLPPIGATMIGRAEGLVFQMRLGESLLGKAKQGEVRVVKARLAGISRRAIDLGITMPLDVVKRWNAEYAGGASSTSFSSAIVVASTGAETAGVLARAAELKLSPKDTRARDVSVLTTGIIALLSLVAGVILLVSAWNIATTFRVLVAERRSEIALYRALGASGRDVASWMMALALCIGLAAGTVGLVVARLAALGADRAAATGLPDFPFKPDTFFAFPAWLIATAVAFAILFSLLGAFGPARRAARVDPALALAER